MPNDAAAEPQVIPVEASEEEMLAFTPPSLRHIEGAPSFLLRVATPREKRARKRLLGEEGAVLHSPEKIRAEMVRGLRQLWTSEQCEQHVPRLEAYWEAWDNYQLQLKDDPDLQWEWDADEEAKIQQLWVEVAQAHRPLAVMNANNREFAELAMAATVAAMVERYEGINVPRDVRRGYLTIDCIDNVAEKLRSFEDRNGLDTGKAWEELMREAARRMFLDEDEAKNSESPSPSTSSQQRSRTTEDGPGTSKASEPSTTSTPASS